MYSRKEQGSKDVRDSCSYFFEALVSFVYETVPNEWQALCLTPHCYMHAENSRYMIAVIRLFRDVKDII